MTLVLSAITRHAVIQVSDRRLVWLNKDGEPLRKDDEQNKAVLVWNRMTISYTGLAELGSDKRTDLWIAKTLAKWSANPESSSSQDAAIDRLATEATRLFSEQPIAGLPPEYKHHCFVIVGWARFNDQPSEFKPYLSCVSNYLDENCRQLPTARPSFQTGNRVLGDSESCFWLPIGQGPKQGHLWDKDSSNAVTGKISRLDPRGDDPDGLAAVLVDEIRRVADNNQYVGERLLLSCIPRRSIRPSRTGEITLVGGPMSDEATFLYLRPDDSSGVQYGPIYVGQSGSIMANFVAGPPGSTNMGL